MGYICPWLEVRSAHAHLIPGLIAALPPSHPRPCRPPPSRQFEVPANGTPPKGVRVDRSRRSGCVGTVRGGPRRLSSRVSLSEQARSTAPGSVFRGVRSVRTRSPSRAQVVRGLVCGLAGRGFGRGGFDEGRPGSAGTWVHGGRGVGRRGAAGLASGHLHGRDVPDRHHGSGRATVVEQRPGHVKETFE